MEEFYIGMNIAESEAGKYSIAEFWNPPNSGVDCYVTEVDFAVVALSTTAPGARAGDIVIFNTTTTSTGVNVLGGIGGNSHNKDTDPLAPPPKAEMRNIRLTPGVNNGITGVAPVQEMWLGVAEDDTTYPFTPAIILRPGSGLMFRAAQSNMYAISSIEWSEKPHTPRVAPV